MLADNDVYRELRVARLHTRLGDSFGWPRGVEILRTFVDRTPMGETWIEIFYLEAAND